MKKCPICKKNISYSFLNIKTNQFCFNCLQNVNPIFLNVEIKKINGIVIAPYNEFAKNVMNKYKNQCDEKVIKIMLPYLQIAITDLLKEYKINQRVGIAFIPDNDEHTRKRKFSTNNNIQNLLIKEIKEQKKIKFLDSFKRLDNIKQGKKSYVQRNITRHNFEGKLEKNINNIIIIDDVISTGQTIFNFNKYLKNQQKDLNIYFITLFGGENLL